MQRREDAAVVPHPGNVAAGAVLQPAWYRSPREAVVHVRQPAPPKALPRQLPEVAVGKRDPVAFVTLGCKVVTVGAAAKLLEAEREEG